ncbi:ABC transporter ATP-binding protein [Streptomyces sp. CFMR 7]|uniref:ABC transporter ATP-binding protein n=1 Tax=Streptomyces sp. CFMR 7 TaxID=1649184 RepID=UPI0011A4A9D3|nr:ABC transporter ATP-binding protein [Streptomyces sp. CFMR 7]
MRLRQDAHTVSASRISTRAIARQLPSTLRRAWTLSWSADRRATIALIVSAIACAVLTALSLHATADLLAALLPDGSAKERLHRAAPFLIIVPAAAAASYLADGCARFFAQRLAPRVTREADLAVIQASTAAELSAYDDKGFGDSRFAATKGAEKMSDLISGAQTLISTSTQLLAALIVVATLHLALLPLVLIAVLPRVWGAVRAARLAHEAAHRGLSDARLRAVLAQYTTDHATAAELRAATMNTFLLNQYRIISGRLENEQITAARRAALTQGAGDALAALAVLTVWAGVLYLALTGRMNVATAVTTVLVVRTANASLTGSVRASAQLFATSLYITDWARFLAQAGQWAARRGTTPAPATGPRLIQARGLTYAYPGQTEPAVRDIDLDLERGQVIALVGENGSGKTTLAKLLTGLYLPTAGTVTWDGTPLADLDPSTAWSCTGLVPQDYTKWPLAARENITLGQPSPEGDAAVHRAAQLAGAESVLKGLPNGLDTSLARSWWGGHDLSGGQWQRLVIARAFHRDAPVLVMDEPTAALDARAEHQVFSRLRELSTERAALFITHRLANARTADKVVVMDSGAIVETGTYNELLGAGGLFAELHRLQEGAE